MYAVLNIKRTKYSNKCAEQKSKNRNVYRSFSKYFTLFKSYF